MSFPDLTRPETVLPGIRLIDREFAGVFRWMGEVNLVKPGRKRYFPGYG